MKYFVSFGERVREVELVERLGELVVHVDGRPVTVDYQEIDRLGQVVLYIEGRSYALSIEGDQNAVEVTLAGHHYSMTIEDERERAAQLAARAANKGGGPVKAVMPGVVATLLVQEGQVVAQGEPLLVLEAMKMQNEIGAPGEGRVTRIHVAQGQAVAAGEVLITLAGIEGEE